MKCMIISRIDVDGMVYHYMVYCSPKKLCFENAPGSTVLSSDPNFKINMLIGCLVSCPCDADKGMQPTAYELDLEL